MRTTKDPRQSSGVRWGRNRCHWLRGQDLNLRPSGYEPDELPGCSTPRCFVLREWLLSRSGGDLLSHVLRRSTIGADALNGRVRDGIGCLASAVATRPGKKPVQVLSCIACLLTGDRFCRY